MPPTFWSNTIWYVLLAITSIISMIVSLIKSKHRKFTIAFTLSSVGLIYLIEAMLVISFNSYKYLPKIVPDEFQDTVIGNIFSQVSVATTSALALTLNLSNKWYILFTFIYYLIELLFVKLGIYQHHWYKSIFTLLAIAPFMWLLKIWYKQLLNSSFYFFYYIALALGTFSMGFISILMPLKLLNIQTIQGSFYDNPTKNHTAFSIVIAFFLINILINVYRWKFHWIWKGVAFIILFFGQYLLYKFHILSCKEGWSLPAITLDTFGNYFWIVVLDHFLKSGPTRLTTLKS